MDWDKVKTFAAAAETGSVTAAADRLGISQSAVSRQLAALEEEIGAPLFQRHARGLLLTGPGQILLEHAREMASVAALAEARLKDSADRPMGELRVTAPVAFGLSWLTPRLSAFTEAYPDMRLTLLLDDREYDLLTLEAECAIRLWPGAHSELVQRKLADMPVGLYASQRYLERHGAPKDVKELDQHRIVGFHGDTASPMRELDWALLLGREGASPREACIAVNHVYGVLQAVEAGAGIGRLPRYMAKDNPRLVQVLAQTALPDFALYFLYPINLKRSRRIAAFRDFLTDAFRAWST
jgi:DNA-binding transcriptional LysR family regulator